MLFVQCKLKPDLAKRADHYFSENMRVVKGTIRLIAAINFSFIGEFVFHSAHVI